MIFPSRRALPSVAKDAAWVLFGQVSGRGTLFLSGAAIAWGMGGDTFADFSYLALTSATLTTVSAIGSGTAITRYVATRLSGGAADAASRIAAACLIGLLGGAATLLLILALPSVFIPASVAYLRTPLIVSLGAQLGGSLAFSALAGERRFAAAAAANTASGLLLMLIAAVSILLKSRELVVWAIPASQVAFCLLTARASLEFMSAGFRSVTFSGVLAVMPSVLWFALPMFVTSLLATTGPWALGILLVGFDKAEFAAYSAGLQWFSLILVVPGALTSAYLPRVFRNYVAPGSQETRGPEYMVFSNAKQALAIALASAVVVLLLGDFLIRFHGQVLRGHKGVFVAFVLAAVLVAPINPLGNGLAARNGQATWMALTAVWWTALLLVARLYPVSTALAAGIDLCFAYTILLLLTLGATRFATGRLPRRRSQSTSARTGE